MALTFDKLLGRFRQSDIVEGSGTAVGTTYDNAASGLAATELQSAVDELDTTMDAYRFKKRIGTWDPADPFPGGAGVESGHYWVVDTAGTRDSIVFTLDDKLVALVDTPSTTVFAANWEKEDDKDLVLSVNTQTGAIVLDADDISDAATTNKFVTASDVTVLGNTSGANSGDQVIPVDSVNTQTGVVVLDADDISDAATTNKFVTAGDLTVLGNTSNTNSGDEADSTTTVKGVIELGTQTEVNTGTDTVRAVTPDTLEDKTMGTYTGTTISDNVVLKSALQELETAVEAAGGSTNIQNTIFVTDNGATSGVRGDFVGNMLTPVTIDFAESIATSGDFIYVYKGNHVCAIVNVNGLSVDGVDYYFEQGAIVTKSTAGSMFQLSTGFTIGSNVYGFGSFYNDTLAGVTYRVNQAGLSWTFDGDICENTVSLCVLDTTSTLTTMNSNFKTSIKSTAGDVYRVNFGHLNVNCPDISTTVGNGFLRAIGTSTTIISGSITSSGTDGISGTGMGERISVTANYISSVLITVSANSQAVFNVSKIDVFEGKDFNVSGYISDLTFAGGRGYVGLVSTLTVDAAGIVGTLDCTADGSPSSNWNLSGTGTVVVNAKSLRTTALYNNQPRQFNVNGSGIIFNLLGDWGWVNSVFNISNGFLNIHGNYINSSASTGINVFVLTGTSKTVLKGTITNDATSSLVEGMVSIASPAIFVWDGTIVVENQNQLPVSSTSAVADVKIKNGFTNRIGATTAKKLREEVRVVADSVATSITVNATLYTAATALKGAMAADLVSQINLDGGQTAVAVDLTGGDFTIEAGVAGTPYTRAFTANTAFTIKLDHNAYGLNNLITGTSVIEDVDITE